MGKIGSHIVIFLVRSYQYLISPLIGPRCRFYPSCSEYMLEAIKQKGLLLGGIKGIYRLFRCHPFAKGGFDPVDKSGNSSCFCVSKRFVKER